MNAAANQLRSYRYRTGKTLREVGEELGVSEATVSRWEAGITKPTVVRMKQLQDRLGIAMGSWILEEPPEPSRTSPTGRVESVDRNYD